MRARTFPLAGLCAGLFLCAVMLSACAGAPTHEEIQTTFDAGLKKYDAGDYEGAYALWHKIDDVDLAAMRNVALMLRKGQGVAKDPKAALAKMAQAAQDGLVTAEADVGEMLVNGEAGPPAPKDGIAWLSQAAAEGHPLAALHLAEIYEAGTAVPKDLDAARKYYLQAANAGVEGAAEHLKSLPAAPEPASPPPSSKH